MEEWLNGTREVAEKLKGLKGCAGLAAKGTYQYMAPSFASMGTGLDVVKTLGKGLDQDGDVGFVSMHK